MEYHDKLPIKLKERKTGQVSIFKKSSPGSAPEVVIMKPKVPDVEELLDLINGFAADKLGGHTDDIAGELNGALVDVRRVLGNADGHLARLTEKLAKSADTATSALEQADKTLVQGEESVARLAESFDEVAHAALVALENLDAVIGEAHLAVEEDSPMRITFIETLDELTKAARTLREAMDYIQRHPESILRGKAVPKGKK